MAKESMKAREVKRAKLVAKYATKRAELKLSSTTLTRLMKSVGTQYLSYNNYREIQLVHVNKTVVVLLAVLMVFFVNLA